MKIESRTCKLDSLKTMQIFIDTSSLEIFINEGEEHSQPVISLS
ncbi:GH32 C-terminal domain-containing protein [Bacillus sp. FJAT-27986]